MRSASLLTVGRRENNDDLEPDEASRVRDALRELLRQCNENQAEVGRRLKDPRSGKAMTGQAIGYIVTGATSPSLATARRIAALRGQTVFEFLAGGPQAAQTRPSVRDLPGYGEAMQTLLAGRHHADVLAAATRALDAVGATTISVATLDAAARFVLDVSATVEAGERQPTPLKGAAKKMGEAVAAIKKGTTPQQRAR